MTMRLANRRTDYWNQEILNWENSRYQNTKSLLGRPLQARLKISTQILSNFVQSRSLVDLGCGSGRLFQNLVSYVEPDPSSHWIGVDISSSAIERATQRMLGPQVQFLCQELPSPELPLADIYSGLGLLDWLSDKEIKELITKIENSYFLFSFSERRSLPVHWMHLIFRRLRPRARQPENQPRYFSESEIRNFLKTSKAPLHFVRSPSMAIGTLVTNLPLKMVGLT